MNKKISLGAAIAFAIIVAAAVFSVTMTFSGDKYNETMGALQGREQLYEKISEIARQVRAEYYDTGVIDESLLQDSLAVGYVKGIKDPFSAYYSADDYKKILRDKKFQEDNVGIGASVAVNPDGYLLVTEVYPDSPAMAEGLQEDSLIVAIDGVNILQENSASMLSSLYGAEGSIVVLTVRRSGEDTNIEIIRRRVEVPTVYAEYIEGGLGYFYISDFSALTSNQFNREFQRLEEEHGFFVMILDLRDTDTTSMESATRLLDRLLPEGTMYSVVDKDKNVKDIKVSDATELVMPIVTLVNANTAGTAELFAQVLQDFGKSRVVGNTTAGRGIQQDIFMLSDGSAIEITVAKYLSRGKFPYHGVGVKPEFDVSLPAGESWKTLSKPNDPQYQKAQELLVIYLRSEGLYKESDFADDDSGAAGEKVRILPDK